MVGVLEQVSGAIEILERVVAELEPVTFDGPRAVELTEALALGERLCAAGKTFMARRVDDTYAWRRDGHRSGAHWLATTTGVSVGAATATMRPARAFDALPSTADAFRAGELSAQQANEITAAAADNPDSEQELLENAPFLVVQRPPRSMPRGARLGSRRRRACPQAAHVTQALPLDRPTRRRIPS